MSCRGDRKAPAIGEVVLRAVLQRTHACSFALISITHLHVLAHHVAVAETVVDVVVAARRVFDGRGGAAGGGSPCQLVDGHVEMKNLRVLFAGIFFSDRKNKPREDTCATAVSTCREKRKRVTATKQKHITQGKA